MRAVLPWDGEAGARVAPGQGGCKWRLDHPATRQPEVVVEGRAASRLPGAEGLSKEPGPNLLPHRQDGRAGEGVAPGQSGVPGGALRLGA